MNGKGELVMRERACLSLHRHDKVIEMLLQLRKSIFICSSCLLGHVLFWWTQKKRDVY
jgi:hypothetical protein